MGERGKIRHFSHEHDLFFYPDINLDFEFRCGMCTGSLGLGYDRVGYCCRDCWYAIHKKCSELPQRMNHPLHALHHLTLAKRSLRSCCYYCEKPFEDEYCYACDECSNFHMHMTCAVIPLPTITSDVGSGQQHDVVRFACHQHLLVQQLVGHHERRERAKCLACHSFWSGPAYSCTFDGCENFLHESCANLPQKIKNPFHSQHTLILCVSKPRSCRSCCEKNCVLIFSCHEDGCDFPLCPKCLPLDTIVKCRRHDHLISLVKNASCEIYCDACQKSYKNWVDIVPNEVNRTRSFLFRCMECDFNLHFLCGPLPSTIKYEYHMHPLVLLDHFVTEEDSDKYYCDACEEEMNPLFRIYCCADCKFVAHVHCLFSEIMKAINEDPEDGELKALGEDRWDQFGDQTEGSAEKLTLKDIMDLLTPDEKAVLIDPISILDSQSKLFRRNEYKKCRQLSSHCRLEGSFDDINIDKIQRFFYQDTDGDLQILAYEIYYFTPEEGLKIDDKYLRQKVVNVDGYMVPKTLASILRTFIHKKGDLGFKEGLTPHMKSITATLLCIVIDKMCKTKVGDATWDDLQYWHFCAGLFQCTMQNFEWKENQWYPHETGPFNVLLRAFLGLEAIRYKENTIKILHSRVAELEADLTRCKGLLEKHKGFDISSASPFVKERYFKVASELKGKDVADLLFKI